MKVSILVSDLSEQGAGRWGGAVRPFLLAQALQKLECQVEVLGFVNHINPRLQSTESLPIHQILGNPYPGFLQSAWQLCRKIKGDIIYAYKPKVGSYGVGLVYHWLTRKPLLLDIDDWELSWHGGDRYQYQPSIKQLARDIFKADGALRSPDHPWYLQQLERWIPWATQITTHNRFLQDRFSGILIPNGKDTLLFNPEMIDPELTRQQYGWQNYRILMFPGAPRPYKGLEDILTALDQINDDRYRLVIVGGSPYDDYDNQLLKIWSRWIIQLPTTPYVEMPKLIAGSDLIVIPQRNHPSAQAQFPLKLTDAMSMAKPILATRVGDIPEILGDTGYLSNPEDPSGLAQQIETIFSDLTIAQKKGEESRLRCRKYYSIEAMAEILNKVLNRISDPSRDGIE